jgi:hypothetical protein
MHNYKGALAGLDVVPGSYHTEKDGDMLHVEYIALQK